MNRGEVATEAPADIHGCPVPGASHIGGYHWLWPLTASRVTRFSYIEKKYSSLRHQAGSGQKPDEI